MIASLELLRELNIVSVIVRLGLAMLCGGLVGLERERKRRPAGFRTYMLVCLGASLTMILSQYFYVMAESQWHDVILATGVKMDISRVGAQVVNGIGFLGAGTIIVTGRHEVKGLTTAAGLWASACMGLAIGAGFYEGVLFGFVFIVLSIVTLPNIENMVIARTKNMNLYLEIKRTDDIGDVLRYLRDNVAAIYEFSVERNSGGQDGIIGISFCIRLLNRHDRPTILSTLADMDRVAFVEEL